jgi:hypothetical protein
MSRSDRACLVRLETAILQGTVRELTRSLRSPLAANGSFLKYHKQKSTLFPCQHDDSKLEIGSVLRQLVDEQKHHTNKSPVHGAQMRRERMLTYRQVPTSVLLSIRMHNSAGPGAKHSLLQTLLESTRICPDNGTLHPCEVLRRQELNTAEQLDE